MTIEQLDGWLLRCSPTGRLLLKSTLDDSVSDLHLALLIDGLRHRRHDGGSRNLVRRHDVSQQGVRVSDRKLSLPARDTIPTLLIEVIPELLLLAKRQYNVPMPHDLLDRAV